jgi:catechol 2,3-dioxygenase-like lactoylglutathione lyase family enzyme
MVNTSRIGYACFETPDLDRQIDYYVNMLGLALVTKDGNRAFLASKLGAPSVELIRGDAGRCTKLAFQAVSPDVAELAAGVSQHGLAVETRTDPAPGVPASIVFHDPKGTEIELFAADVPVPITAEIKGVAPLKLGHLAFNCTDVMQCVEFYQKVLGFRISDWRGDYFYFLRCNADHHTVNFVHGDKVKMHHIAFELKDWSEIQRACDFLGMNGIRMIWGPGRHGPGHNVFTYHRNPDGLIVELFTELDRMSNEALGYFDPRPWHEDRPQRPKRWEPNPASTNLWGGGAPPDFGK